MTKRKPTALRLLTGNAGRRPFNEDEPKPPPGEVKPPAWIRGRARRGWRKIAPVLEEMGVLTTADQLALELLCDAYGELLDLRAGIEAEGTTYETVTKEGATMYRPRPEVAMASSAWRRVSAMLKEFGLTPSARAGVHVPGVPDDDPFEAFTGRGRQR